MKSDNINYGILLMDDIMQAQSYLHGISHGNFKSSAGEITYTFNVVTQNV